MTEVLWNLAQYKDPFDSFMSGQDTRAQWDQRKARKSALENIAMGPDGQMDYQAVAARLAKAGLFKEAHDVGALGTQGLAPGYRRTPTGQEFITGGPEDPANIRNKAAAQREPSGYKIEKIKDEDGNETLVRVAPDGTATRLNTGLASPPAGGPPSPLVGAPGTAPQVPGRNPYAPPGKLTDEQAKAGGYADRMAEAHGTINKYENINEGLVGNLAGRAANLAPDTYGSVMAGPERQQVMQAQRNFINAILRRESGAVISEAEFANAKQQYFPQPGDSKEVLAQKKANRETSAAGLMRGAGKHYQVPPGFGPQQQPAGSGAAPPQAPQARPQVAPQAQPQGPVGEGTIIRNPQTGVRAILRNGQWEPMQ